MFRLRVPKDALADWASCYSYTGEAEIEERVAPAARARGYLVRDEFLALCRWKTPRSQRHCAKNRDDYVSAVTRIALTTRDEELKIRVLLGLNGVSWPTASVVLYFCDQGAYPILDFRALWSVGVRQVPAYSFSSGGSTRASRARSVTRRAYRCERSTARCGSTRRSITMNGTTASGLPNFRFQPSAARCARCGG
jgi:hypothetical protein